VRQDPILIEPSTGRSYSVYNSPYLGVEALWSNKNYWINMRPSTSMKNLSFDLTNSDIWEYVFIDPFNIPPKNAGGNADGDQVRHYNLPLCCQIWALRFAAHPGGGGVR
jgi:hypothetical protein